MATTRINLDLLGRMVTELNAQLLKVKEAGDNQTAYAELSKCLGLTSGIVMEATALAGDTQKELQLNSVPEQPEGLPGLEELFSGKVSRSSKN